MIFTTPQFVLFAVLFFGLYSAVAGRPRKVLLLVASYFFYGSWNAKFLLLIVGSTLLDFYLGRAIHRSDDSRRRKRLVLASVIGNLGALGFFKYFNFFIDSAVTGLNALGLDASPATLSIVLPVGISFYTFQTMSYTLDIYRGKLTPTDSLLDFALFVAFFPQLVAGPIERASHLLPQIAGVGDPNRRGDLSGWGLIALGAFKKAVIADNLAPLVEAAYSDPSTAYAPALWLGTYAFAIQIYCDFSGYSDIAVGLGRLMGLDIIQNFKAPYCAAGPSDLWRRWHISLSSWLRDYLYIGLGGNRGGTWRVTRNLILTMVLGGLWHGAAWNFVLWGAFHGLLLVAFRPQFWTSLWRRVAAHLPGRIVGTIVRRLVFFHLVCLGWALFRAQSLADCRTLLWRLVDFTRWDLGGWLVEVEASGEGRYLAFVAAVMGALVLAQNVWRVGSNEVVARLWSAPAAVRFTVVVALLYACTLLAPEQPPPFIYFQF